MYKGKHKATGVGNVGFGMPPTSHSRPSFASSSFAASPLLPVVSLAPQIQLAASRSLWHGTNAGVGVVSSLLDCSVVRIRDAEDTNASTSSGSGAACPRATVR